MGCKIIIFGFLVDHHRVTRQDWKIHIGKVAHLYDARVRVCLVR